MSMEAAAGRLAGRVVLVTGASRGLGAAVAEACAAEGAHLVLVARTRGALEEVDDAVRRRGGEATLVTLDITRGDLVDALGGALHERFRRLDGFVACAADLGAITPVSHLEPKVLDQALAVNLVANQRLIRSLDPLLRASDAGRAVFVTDGAVLPGRAYWGAYAVSKAGLEALVLSYAAETRITPVRVNLLDPGPMATRLRERAFPGERPGTQPSPAEKAPALVELLLPGCTRHSEIVRLAQPGA
jgi:NAD(P)-dependent dehydrogenase (short-subunit alcohol dehydrogenase family)